MAATAPADVDADAEVASAPGPKADVDGDGAASSRCELLLTLAVRTAPRRNGADVTHDGDSGLWWAWRVALPTPGFFAAARDVTAIVSVLEAVGFHRIYRMSPRDLAAVILQPVGLGRGALHVSVELACVATATGMAPSAVVATRLLEILILDELARHGQGP